MPRGVIVVRVKEAHGRNKKDDIVWEQNFIEGFVRAELRGADKSKLTDQTSTKRVLGNEISWDEELRLDVTDNSKELRLMLCREKKTHSRSGVAVISACGIFVEDILQAVPINKFFELFKPRAVSATEGGMIKVNITFEDHSGRPRGGAAGSRQEQRSEEDQPPLREFRTQLSLDPEGFAKGGPEPPQQEAANPRRRASNLGDVKEEDSDYQESEAEPEAAPITVADNPKSGNKLLKAGFFLLIAAAAGAGVLKHQKKGPFKEEKK